MIHMKLSKEGAIELIGHEAIVQTRYRDSKGIWTIGVGHTAAAGGIDPATFTGKLTMRQVFELFEKDVQRYADDVNRALTREVTQQQFDALVSFHYNTGAIARASITRFINAGHPGEAAKAFMVWNKPAEIIARRKKEQKLFMRGVYSNRGIALVVSANDKGSLNWGKAKRVNVGKEMMAA